MPPALTFLDGVRWRGAPVAGERAQTLLAVLVRRGREGAGDERLVGELWGEDLPANPAKALQVVVSRTRAACAPEVVLRTARGYRLGLPDDEVDVLRLGGLVARARAALTDGDAEAAREHAHAARQLAEGVALSGPVGGPLDEVLAAASDHAADAGMLLGVALHRCGEHAAALPWLETAAAGRPGDEELLVALLRSEAAVRGPGAALSRYESYRRDLVERLGVEPGEPLRRVHHELLALDRPVRDGLLFDTTSLLGRDADLAALRALLHTGRVTSIVGAGGLGKTRLAHVLGREAGQPVVQFVELVGVTTGDDVVSEVGSVLGVRDSVTSRRALTPAQRADVRARIAQHLGQAPALLILDNCEHVVEAVADLVAFLVATTRDLHVLATSRAPLAIAAERVYPLAPLGAPDAAELFRTRAVAARPGVALDDRAVADIVARLDGLPLAIELAAVKVRVMSVADVARRLEDRFSLLRGGVRGAPDRHQTLLAVIDWSHNLVTDRERRAWRRLSVFHDGFTLAAAEAVLGPEAVDAVHALVDQSLLAVREAGASVRFRMLETVREFGRRQLVESGEEAEALAAHRRWATAYADAARSGLHGPDQVRCMHLLLEEETNLADALRQALAAPDPADVVVLYAALTGFWSISGDHARVVGLIHAVQVALRGWTPPPELAGQTRMALAGALNNTVIVDELGFDVGELWAQLRRLGPGPGPSEVAASVAVTLALDPEDPEGIDTRLEELSDGADHRTAVKALMWRSHSRENAGDIEAAIALTARALAMAPEEDGPWSRAMLHTQLAQLHAGSGQHGEAAGHARRAIPVLERLGVDDDRAQLLSVTAVHALVEGRLEEAERIFAAVDGVGERGLGLGSRVVRLVGRAELALARGRTSDGLAFYRAAVTTARELRFPGFPSLNGHEPWTVSIEATALTAHALHGCGDGAELAAVVRGKACALFAPGQFHDHPVLGLALHGLGMWSLCRNGEGTTQVPVAVRLLALAERLAYSRSAPTMDWTHAVDAAERAAPGLLEKILEEYGERRGPGLLEEARAVVCTLR
ncbi:BTAD domain-containing putative transcriptional regulator [Pseudonocardia sp. MH-G8]|uniref:ATP-binding protein n=1 Tax=Pseudonocardia sp. MH-G8 TaxID=1854588 RepID=UPI000B9FC353|nr:BTAD domain-containing putative transcriptional regulator [Pseudonocardia sp. MH-G8]OZM81140.1 transcriptional regulator [Pseudonocardia sp. MH-G8]